MCIQTALGPHWPWTVVRLPQKAQRVHQVSISKVEYPGQSDATLKMIRGGMERKYESNNNEHNIQFIYYSRDASRLDTRFGFEVESTDCQLARQTNLTVGFYRQTGKPVDPTPTSHQHVQ